ncbi:hypothetical protein DYB37_012779, partial [Aphanomyces astaci]
SHFVEAIGSGQRQGNGGSLSGNESHSWIQDQQETRGLKTQFELLIKTPCEGEVSSMRNFGTSEDYTERDLLLTDIKARIDDFEETAAVR